MSPLLSCPTLLLILLAICQSAGSSRPRGFGETAEIVQDGDSSQKSNLINDKKDGHKMIITDTQGTPKPQTTSSVTQNSSGSMDNMEVGEMVTRSHKRHTSNHSSRKRNNHHQFKLLSETGGGGTKVTYRVPQRKRGEKQPGFNLDYSPPKVHPPHHN